MTISDKRYNFEKKINPWPFQAKMKAGGGEFSRTFLFLPILAR